MVSTVLWCLVLLPQLLRNQHRRSVDGLNLLWAIANFSASLCNVVFMFRIDVPVQTRIMAVYMPLLEFCMLLQFWAWYRPSPSSPLWHHCRYTVGALCVVLWTAAIGTQALVYSSSSYFAWVAIVLWSVETFPQIYTNIHTPSSAVLGQSVLSILIAVVGKTTDALSAYLLVMPEQTRVLAYYSSTSAWLNPLIVLVLAGRCNQNGTSSLIPVKPSALGRSPVAVSTSYTYDAPGESGVVARPAHQIAADVSPLLCAQDRSSSAGAAAPPHTRHTRAAPCANLLHCFCDPLGIERSVRLTLGASTMLQYAVCMWLLTSMAAVLVAVTLRVWAPWVAALPMSSIAVVGMFYLQLRWK